MQIDNNDIALLQDEIGRAGNVEEGIRKSVHFGANVSHSHRRSNRIWKPNIKSVRVKTEGGAKKMYVCTSCLKSGRVERA